MTSQLPSILVIRHGETQWNVAGRLQGFRDTPLTVNGIRQALAVAVRLSSVLEELHGAGFWVSPLGRARQTASILADTWSVPFEDFVEEKGLSERSYGVWEGLSLEEVQRQLPDQFEANEADPWNYCMPGGESRTAFTDRVRAWLDGLDASRPHVVVTHSGSLRALRGIYTRASGDTILTYREPQTAAFLLSEGKETMLNPSSTLLRAMGCEGGGRTVAI
ncbi:histidine phosphatase family protein [Nitratireductor pacificus]|uniref:Phosphoglycerate/bisphosphoglycerate mutase n=1 Tax=Nitratireductor pacificus pht-3B TaxID=391937 RepID=K2LGX7_9HYPH|nr:histidine phosphatase family protein [Nitratireductor pacificus]EKF17034.1 phosphoglycerate/bisphosphoglycerate mutase [Nitratireductor pacificus pht-3B]